MAYSSLKRRQAKVEVDVVYVETGKDKIVSTREITIQASREETLFEAICKALPQDITETMSNDLKCYSNEFQEGEQLDTQQCVEDVDYIMEAYIQRRRSVLFVCKDSYEKSKAESIREPHINGSLGSAGSSSDSVYSLTLSPEPAPFYRSGSFMVKQLLTPTHNRGQRTLRIISTNSDSQESSEDSDVFQSIPSTFRSVSPQPRSKPGSFDESSTSRNAKTLTHTASAFDCSSAAYIQHTIGGNAILRSKNGMKKPPQKRFSVLNIFAGSRKSHSVSSNHEDTSITITSPQLPMRPLSPTEEDRGPSPEQHCAEEKRKAFRHHPAVRRKSTLREYHPMELIVESGDRDNSQLDIFCHDRNSIAELKQNIAEELNQHGSRGRSHWRACDFSLSYKCDGTTYELFNDSQLLFNTSFCKKMAERELNIPLQIRLAGSLPQRELNTYYRISQVSGVIMEPGVEQMSLDKSGMTTIPSGDRAEVEWARRTLHDHVMAVAGSRNAEEYALSMEINSTAATTVLALKIPLDNRIPITFHYRSMFSLMKNISVQRYATSVFEEIFPIVVKCGLVQDRITEYTLQVTGEESYIHGERELLEFKDIRRCIMKGDAIHLSITKKPSTELDRPFEYSPLPLDPLSCEPPQYSDITAKPPKNHSYTSALWDCNDTFSFELKTVENLPTQIKSNKANLCISVEVLLYHGETELCPAVVVQAMPLRYSRIELEKQINFNIQKKNLSKAAKIMVIIREGPRGQSRSSIPDTTKFLYWGLVSVFNHWGVLRSGEYKASMWQGKKVKATDAVPDEIIHSNPVAPAVNNPNPGAVTITLQFESPEEPCILPALSHKSREAFFQFHPAAKSVDVKRAFQKVPAAIKQGLLSMDNLPATIARVKWDSLAETLEVHSLLQCLAKDAKTLVPVEVVLQLLDCSFIDAQVRAFAVSILEGIHDDRLEDSLLQLVQAIKFEPNHDSSLARFLLQRALKHKRIGHFFFWYLKCEMHNPLFRTRFAVILEAYLKACGEAMLTRFMDQIQIQAALEEIGTKLKEDTNDPSKMQERLPVLLQAYNARKFNFVPVHNPRTRLGLMRIEKCKVMTSAKRPIWLELLNTHQTALTHTPSRLILKVGDDLRQDMITLRVFSLFEKIWEDQGLDLCLVPYGCIATGPKTGFIEVVKNARTIAEVSGVRNEKKLLEWIISQQKNEFGEIDQDLVEAAVKKFTQSCAGYSVATYVLGVGDRHNDNIMVTTSGNLFHIDFGHFLGNIKYFMGFKREWAPFVLTPDFVHVMGGENGAMFKMYKNYCCRAFLALRRQASLIINLFALMRSTGIPELTCVDDTNYIKEALVLNKKSETEAEIAFMQVIQKCLSLKWTVQLMWQAHKFKHNTS